jgi:hypothetical protein
LALTVACSETGITRQETVDVFFQEPAERVDILIVVDNSGSMAPYQRSLGDNFNAFIQFFIDANVDYHIAITTTTIQKPEYTDQIPQCTQTLINEIPNAGHIVNGTVITSNTPDADLVFRDLVNVGVCGAGFEMGLEAARLALTPELLTTVNSGFIREQAELSVIFVSDEEDVSPFPVNEYINELRGVKGQRSREAINASSLTVIEPAACENAAGSSPGARYVDVTTQTNGVSRDLCDQNFESIVTDLSLNSSRLRDTYFLGRTPDLNTLSVGVENDIIPCDSGEWTFEFINEGGEDLPAIVFARDSLPPIGSQITIRYNNGSGMEDGFCSGGAL